MEFKKYYATTATIGILSRGLDDIQVNDAYDIRNIKTIFAQFQPQC